MSDEKDLGKELLRQNGIERGSVPEERRKELRARAQRDKARARAAKLGVVFGCGTALVVLIVLGMLGSDGGVVDVMKIVLGNLCIMVPIIVAFLWFIGMYFGQRQMQTTLADISAQLERLAKKQETKAPE